MLEADEAGAEIDPVEPHLAALSTMPHSVGYSTTARIEAESSRPLARLGDNLGEAFGGGPRRAYQKHHE